MWIDFPDAVPIPEMDGARLMGWRKATRLKSLPIARVPGGVEVVVGPYRVTYLGEMCIVEGPVS